MAEKKDIREFRKDLASKLEKLRNLIIQRIPSRDLGVFNDVLEQIQSFVMRGSGEFEHLKGRLQYAKDTTRNSLRKKPVAMLELLNQLDDMDDEVLDFVENFSK
jgi:hypothetical protein